MRTAFFTIASWNYMAFARAWAESAHATNPEADVILVLADVERADFSAGPLFDRVIAFDALGLDNPRHRAFRYNIAELNTSLKPGAFLKLFELGYDRVLYFDPDIRLYDRVHAVNEAFEGGANAVLTPHATAPNENAEIPNELMFLHAGIYNLGFMAIARSEETLGLLRWWARRLEYLCLFNRLGDGLFADQKWIDLWPAYCSAVTILRHPGYNVAFFNLDSRVVARRPGEYVVNGQPLVFFHFSGLVPGDRGVLSRHQHRLVPTLNEALWTLFNAYQDSLERHGRETFQDAPYAFDRFAHGVAITDAHRRHFRDTLEPFAGDPFSEACYAACFTDSAPRVTTLRRLLPYFRPIYRFVPEKLRRRVIARLLSRPIWTSMPPQELP